MSDVINSFESPNKKIYILHTGSANMNSFNFKMLWVCIMLITPTECTRYLIANNPDSSTSNTHACTPVVNSVEALLYCMQLIRTINLVYTANYSLNLQIIH